MKRKFFIKLTLLIPIIIFMLACSTLAAPATPTPTPVSCYEENRSFFSSAEGLLNKWRDTKAVIESTPRIALSPLITDLQDMKREAETLKVSSCAQPAKDALITYMNSYVDACLSFMSNDDDQLVSTNFSLAELNLADYVYQEVILRSTPTPSK